MNQITKQPPVLVLIDGKSVFYRGYYAMPHLTTKDGMPTGGVYGFAVLALELIKRINPDYVAVAWDKPKTNIRRRLAIYPQYKAGRVAPPADFYAQIPVLKDLLASLNWPFYELDDYEADDIIGTLAQAASRQGIHTIIISSDLDMLQLLSDRTELYALKKGLAQVERFDPVAFTQKYGIRVDQFLDLKSLKGDASDNIPGVPGIGEKTGVKLLQKYGTLDEVYRHVAEQPATLQNKLLAGKNSAYMSQALARIDCTAPLTLDLAAMNSRQLDRVRLRDTLLKLEFTSLVNNLPEGYGTSSVELTAAAPQLTLVQHYAVLPSMVLAQVIDGQLYISSDVATACRFDWSEVAQLANKRVITYDAKALAKAFLAQGKAITWTVELDVKHAEFLLNSLGKIQPLAQRTATQYGSDTPLLQLAMLWQLFEQTNGELARLSKLDQLARQVDFPFQILLAQIEQYGVLVDRPQLELMSRNLGKTLVDLAEQIYQRLGIRFNINSPKQLSGVLFDQLHLKPRGKRNKGGYYSTGAKELEHLRNQHWVIDLIEQYRATAKLKSTYVDALIDAISSDGRIHTTFSQDIVATGRLSSANPNLQSVPARTEQGKQIKRCFIAPPGKVIVNADYAQFELRLVAALAHDTDMIELFNDPATDIHTMTAAAVYGIAPDKVTPEMRRHAKTINFGILYGMSARGLADATKMSFGAAAQFIKRYFELHQPIRRFMDEILAKAEQTGYVETWYGRRRPMPDLKANNAIVREAAKRAAINMPIQGTEADLMKRAMLRISTALPQATQILQVHDSIMLECAESEADTVVTTVKQIMEQIAPDLGVRLIVDAHYGRSWGDL